ncbi:Hypothetical predicted protein [Cloeon dipterum]|uniref:Uncharacterized protein n=1 Tax=Cloeon dipterum TaxID=197152 RepID=A0A8S1DEG2_9INSE|nr:Hypothetical predicted protein [Cloeon dipterum]
MHALSVVLVLSFVTANLGLENCHLPENGCMYMRPEPLNGEQSTDCFCQSLNKTITLKSIRKGYVYYHFDLFNPTNAEPFCPPSIKDELEKGRLRILNHSMIAELHKAEQTYLPRGAIITFVAATYDAVLFSVLVAKYIKLRNKKQVAAPATSFATVKCELKRENSTMRKPAYVSINHHQPPSAPKQTPSAINNDEYEIPSKITLPVLPPPNKGF